MKRASNTIDMIMRMNVRKQGFVAIGGWKNGRMVHANANARKYMVGSERMNGSGRMKVSKLNTGR